MMECETEEVRDGYFRCLHCEHIGKPQDLELACPYKQPPILPWTKRDPWDNPEYMG